MKRLLASAALTFAAAAFAQEAAAPAPEAPPSAEVIKQVVEFLEHGKDRGPALIDAVPCLKVDQTKGSPTQFQCLEPVTGPVSKGTTVFAWLQWYVPKDGKYEDITIQVLHGSEIRQTIDLPLSGFGRTRGWRGANLSKPGKWTFKIRKGDRELGAASVDVAG